LLGTNEPARERETIEAYVSRHQGLMFSELVQLLSIPNAAADRPNIRRNAEHLWGMLERRGLVAEILETTTTSTAKTKTSGRDISRKVPSQMAALLTIETK
jgi:hypothetical protein